MPRACHILTVEFAVNIERMRALRYKHEKTGSYIIAIFLAGIIMGSLFSNTLDPSMDTQAAEIASLVSNFISNTNNNGLSKAYLLGSSLLTYGKQVILIWLFGLFPITIPLIGLLVGVQGFSYGFTTAFFVMEYNLKGFLLCLGAYGMQGTVFVLIMFLLATEAVRFGRKDRPVSPKIYAIYLLVALASVSLIAIYETYGAPIIIQGIMTRFF